MSRKAGDAGYTLVELLIVIAILGMVAAAIVGVYEVSVQAYVRSASLEDAQLGARAGLERMITELRLVGAFWAGATGAGTAITAATGTSITFMADVNGDTVSGDEMTVSSNPNSTTVVVGGTATQVVNAFNIYQTAALNDHLYIASGATREVSRLSGVSGSTLTLATALTKSYPPGSLVRSVEQVTYTLNAATGSLTRSVGGSGAFAIVDNVAGLTLTYFDANGTLLGQPVTLALIREIQISLTTQGNDGSRRTMTSRVRPRNL